MSLGSGVFASHLPTTASSRNHAACFDGRVNRGRGGHRGVDAGVARDKSRSREGGVGVCAANTSWFPRETIAPIRRGCTLGYTTSRLRAPSVSSYDCLLSNSSNLFTPPPLTTLLSHGHRSRRSRSGTGVVRCEAMRGARTLWANNQRQRRSSGDTNGAGSSNRSGVHVHVAAASSLMGPLAGIVSIAAVSFAAFVAVSVWRRDIAQGGNLFKPRLTLSQSARLEALIASCPTLHRSLR